MKRRARSASVRAAGGEPSPNTRAQDGDGFFEIATRRSVARRATRVAIIVGIVLGMLNHGDAILAGAVTAAKVAKICLTFFVPYSVSIYSSVLAIRGRDLRRNEGGAGCGELAR